MVFVYIFFLLVNKTMAESSEDALALREIVLNTRKPIVLRNFKHVWPCFRHGLSNWCHMLDKYSKNKPYFERISILDANEPQWERKRQRLQLPASEFLRVHSEKQNFWSGMNYKRMQELPVECTGGVDFGLLGFAHAKDDCTLWLSSEGANTPCHYDTYGCNVVVQVFGRKSWYLLPPASPLTTTRIPYEESSIYCKENFYSPSAKDKLRLSKLKEQLYHCILEPNDVLIVPKHWWHFVKALEVSLSVNAWIPLKSDVENQIDECISKYIIENFVQGKSTDIKEHILNPNQLSEMTSDEDLLEVMEYLITQKCIYESGETCNKSDNLKYDYHYLQNETVMDMLSKNQYLSEVPLIRDTEFQKLMNTNGEAGINITEGESPMCHLQETLINSVCNPNVVELIKQEFFSRYNPQS